MDKINAGIIINDVSDHLPIFACCHNEVKRPNKVLYKYCRNVTTESLTQFKSELENVKWDNLYSSDDVNYVYDVFIDIVKKLYDQC